MQFSRLKISPIHKQLTVIEDGFSSNAPEKLSEEQSKKLLFHLENHVYLFVKDIIPYVVSTFGIVYTIPGMRNWLHKHGLSYKKPAIVPGKANKERQTQWIEEYRKLRQELPADEAIFFTDGVHPTHILKQLQNLDFDFVDNP